MIFSIFQVFGDRERWFIASVRHFNLYSIHTVVLVLGYFLEMVIVVQLHM